MQQSSHIHSYQHHSYIRTVTYPPSTPKNAAQVLSHFFRPPHSRPTPVRFMQFKVTKASSGVHSTPLLGAINKLKHSQLLYDDPAFSADPTANPLCAANHDLSSWITEPPKGHPIIRPREVHADPQSGEVALIQPPNSPVYLNAQAHPVNPMTMSTESTLMSSPPTSVPDLSLTASSASDSSLPTPTASRLSLGTSKTTTMSSAPPPASNKKRIGLPFFRRKPEPPPSRPTNTSLASATKAISSASPSQIQRQTINSQVTASMPSQAFRGYQHATGSARELDMIDELDETNPLGVALHHGGPYEAIQKVPPSRAQVQRTAHATNQPSSAIYRRQFRFDVPLKLSPGQILPHSVTAYYRPQAAPVGNVLERVDFGAPVVNRDAERQGELSAADRGVDSVAKQYSVANPSPTYDPRGTPSERPLHRHTSSEPVVLPENNKFRTPDAHPPKASPPPTWGSQLITASNVSVVAGNVDYDPTGEKRVATHTLREQERRYTYDDPRKQRIADLGNPQMPRMAPAPVQAEERPQGFPGGFQQYTPPHLERIGPQINQDQHRQRDPRPGPVRGVPRSQPSVSSSSSTFRSGASSVMTAATNASSVSSSRNRILPKQLVMPAPLAKATASSRPLPTQPQQHWQNMRQHRIRFGDGSEYELPVTNTDVAIPMPYVSESPTVMKPPATKPTTTRTSMSHNGKLKKRPSFRGPEPPEIVARLAIAPGVMHKSKYMEPPPTIPEAPRIATNASVKQEMKRLLSKKKSTL